MPLTEQEARCVELACEHLESIHSGAWRITEYVDQQHLSTPTPPTPEVLVENGAMTAAIEVKRLTGDSPFQEYRKSIQSLKRSLTPSCGGYYYLDCPVDLRLPLDLPLCRHLKKEIERVAPTLGLEQATSIRVPRQGHIALVSASGPPCIYCLHDSGIPLLRPLLDRITGQFSLVDEGLEHSFFTDEGRNQFLDIVTERCKTRLAGDYGPFSWYEEWELRKADDKRKGVWIIAGTEVRDFPSSAAECVYSMLEKGHKKFMGTQWANVHVLVFECSVLAPERLVSEVVAGLESDELKGIDMILLVDRDSLTRAYPATASFSATHK